MTFVQYTRVDLFNKRELSLTAPVNELINEKIKRCSLDPFEHPIVRIAPNTYVNVRPNVHTHNMIGWTLGNQKGRDQLPVFFEVRQLINHNQPSVMSTLAGRNPVWKMTCVGRTSHLPNSRIKKVLMVKYINGLPVERVMPYWGPIIQKLGDSTRGGNWRIPLMYMTRPESSLNEGPLGVHIPLPEKNANNSVIQSLFKNKSNSIKCVFDMENLEVVTIDGCEYLVAKGTIANYKSSLFSITMVIGVYNQAFDESEDADNDSLV